MLGNAKHFVTLPMDKLRQKYTFYRTKGAVKPIKV